MDIRTVKMGRIKAIKFDLDDTLLDNAPLMDSSLRQGIAAMIAKGFKVDIDEALVVIKKIIEKDARKDKFLELARHYGQKDLKLIEQGRKAYATADIKELVHFSGVAETLALLHATFTLVLVTQGNPAQQRKKIALLGISHYFDHILTPHTGEKEQAFRESMNLLKLTADEILIVGDRIDAEIKMGNKLGMTTVRILQGKYSRLSPEHELEKPDFTIKEIKEVIAIVHES